MIQLLWSALLTGHAMCGLVLWWIAPAGSTTADLWLNQVLPFVPVGMLVLGLAARGKAAEAVLPPLFAAYPLFWMAFSIALRVTFPESAGAMWQLPFAAGFGVALLWMRQYRFRLKQPLLAPLFLVPAVWAGWALPESQRALDPATHPANVALAEPGSGPSDGRLIKLSKEIQAHSDDGRVVLKRGEVILTVQPLMAFTDRSPDRGSTASAEPQDRLPTTRKLLALVRDGARFVMHYKDEDRSTLELALHDGEVELEARSRLPHSIYSHLNHYAEVTIRGHKKLTVSFSPMPQKHIELMPPSAPRRFAYLDARGTLHVVDASKQNLGPFTEVASGDPARDRPLELTLWDGDTPLFRVALADFFAQASTQMSPAAGWGVPENVIELVRGGDAPDAPALISLSLAATPIGRGTRSVGHAEGVYRNRMTIVRAP
jgi:hypothetical protein